MKVCYVSPFYPASITDPDEMLVSWPLLRRLPPALVALGHEVVVLAHAGRASSRTIDGARYRFVNAGWTANHTGRLLNHWKPHYGPAYYLPAWRLVRMLRRERPDIVHFSGLTLDLQLAQTAWMCSRMRVPLIVHFHGGVPAQGRMRRVQRVNLHRTARVLFTTHEQADPWIQTGLIDAARVAQVIESSSPFGGIDPQQARRMTGMYGDPVYLSAGRLDAVKDPLTMLHGFERIATGQPNARLYLYYLTAELMPAISAFLDERPSLAARIELRGRAPLDAMEAVYSSADFLLQASLREWSGLAVIEAMSCGCVPIVSDIPSFRQLTVGGTFGRTFPVGDAEGLALAALAISDAERVGLAQETRNHFVRQLSFGALARQIDAVYRDVCTECALSHQ